jgi:hypothetical protein
LGSPSSLSVTPPRGGASVHASARVFIVSSLLSGFVLCCLAPFFSNSNQGNTFGLHIGLRMRRVSLEAELTSQVEIRIVKKEKD